MLTSRLTSLFCETKFNHCNRNHHIHHIRRSHHNSHRTHQNSSLHLQNSNLHLQNSNHRWYRQTYHKSSNCKDVCKFVFKIKLSQLSLCIQHQPIIMWIIRIIATIISPSSSSLILFVFLWMFNVFFIFTLCIQNIQNGSARWIVFWWFGYDFCKTLLIHRTKMIFYYSYGDWYTLRRFCYGSHTQCHYYCFSDKKSFVRLHGTHHIIHCMQ